MSRDCPQPRQGGGGGGGGGGGNCSAGAVRVAPPAVQLDRAVFGQARLISALSTYELRLISPCGLRVISV